ncbi:MAG TPA: hypothetical protein VF210_15005 [Pseudomonadales bacterium]
MLATLLKWTMLASLLLLPVACWNADVLADGVTPLPALGREPEQTPIEQPPFRVSQGGVDYEVTPLFRYRLHGLVVSRRTHDGERMLHRRWNDHLNVADVCVVWGDNATADLSAFEFWSGQFTCFFETHDPAAWRRFRPDQISNNHLLSDDPWLRERIAALRVGDQIRLEGYLASYRNDSGFERGTSVVRTDTGNGACETVYVTGFDVLQDSPSIWPDVQRLAGFGLIGSVLLWVLAALRDWV